MSLLRDARARRMALTDLKTAAARVGLKIETHNPGDGMRIRVFLATDDSDFHGPSTGMASFYGRSRGQTIDLAMAFIDGYAEANKQMEIEARAIFDDEEDPI